VTMMHHPLTWASPRPLWRGAVTPGRAPTILRFASDDFMEQLLGLLATDPAKLGQHVARHETWRTPPGELATSDLVERIPLPSPVKKARLGRLLPNKASDPAAKPANKALKLYQPAHQRYYIATATLACAIPGLPDRTLRGGHEQTGFVLRRLLPPGKTDPTKERPVADENITTELAAGRLVEYAYIKTADGNRWQRVADHDSTVLAPGEDLLPVFPLTHLDSQSAKRTMWGGLIPVGRREEYLGANISRTAVKLFQGQLDSLKPASPVAPKDSVTARMTEFKMDVAEPWKAMIRAAQKAAAEIARDPNEDDPFDPAKPFEAGVNPRPASVRRQDRAREQNLQLQMQSWLILLDFANYLDRNLKPVWTAIKNGNGTGLNSAEQALFNWLNQSLESADLQMLRSGFNPLAVGMPTHVATLSNALRGISPFAQKLEDVETHYRADPAGIERAKWPDFHYLLAGIGTNGSGGAAMVSGAFQMVKKIAAADTVHGPIHSDDEYPVGVDLILTNPAVPISSTDFDINEIDKITALVTRALPRNAETQARPLPFAQQLSQTMRDTANDPGLFRIRFVHINEDCGPLHPPVVSEPTDWFRLANFFDSDAPVRPIRITLPTDTSAAGLRKHARGTAFVMSNLLCGQVQRAKGLGFVDLVLQVLPWPFHKTIKMDAPGTGGCKDGGGIDIGMICSLSIPIITICALILLMMIVLLLDFIFRWIPWFIMCFPLPGLKSKGGSG
jgi:hypothetical protein